MTSIWRENMLGYLSLDIICSSKLTVFLELRSRKTVRFSEQIIGSLRNHDGDAEDNVEQKMNLYFTYESRDTRKSFTLFITVKTISKLNVKHSDKYEIEILKFSRRGPRSPDDAELCHFTSLICRGRQRNVQRFKTHVHSHC